MANIDDDEFAPRHDAGPTDLLLVRHEVHSNAQRLIILEQKYQALKDLQDRLIRFGRHGNQQQRNYRLYMKVLFDEIHRK